MLNEIDLSRIDLNLLVLFEVVMEERHVGRAAARLNLSPSAVSHGLRRLRGLFHDPLFLRNPKGVVPTVRAHALAQPIADILSRTRSVITSAGRFDAKTSTRRFTISVPDALAAVVLVPLLTETKKVAPGVNLSIRNLLAPFETAIADLDTRTSDVAIVPVLDAVPARFAVRTLFEEEFVIAMRAGHPLGKGLTLQRYCAAQHLLVSHSGDPQGFVDRDLAEHGLTRRVALVVPNFMLALAIVSDTDLIAAIPKSLIKMHAKRFRLQSMAAPVQLSRFQIRAMVPKVALQDAGLSWFIDTVEKTSPGKPLERKAGKQA